jgi:hypothetical protein
MKTEELQEYINILELGNTTFQAIKNHPLIVEIKKDANLRYIIPKKEEKPVDDSALEIMWTTNRSAKNIAAYLRLNGYTIDYKTSTVTKDGGKNNTKVGRVLNTLNPKLLENWKKITNEGFSTKKSEDKIWIISANPEDLCGSSYKRKWTSCTSDGHHMSGLGNNRFSLIAYLCDKEDTTIKNPHCRYFIHIGIPRSTQTKNVTFKLTGDNIPPEMINLRLNSPKEGTIGSLFIDTKYGNCSSTEYQNLVSFVNTMNDTVLDMNGVKRMAIVVTGLYVNAYPTPKEVVRSNSKSVKKTVKTKANSETLAMRAKAYSKWSNRPSYELVEYIIKNNYFSNSALTDFIISDKEFSQFINDDAIGDALKRVQDVIEENKQQLIDLKDYTEIVQITDKITINVKNYDAIVKFREKIQTAQNSKKVKI